MKITINGRDHDVPGGYLSYEELVKLAGKTGNPSATYLGPRMGDMRRGGIMHPGCKPIELEEGMHFDVVHTGNA